MVPADAHDDGCIWIEIVEQVRKAVQLLRYGRDRGTNNSTVEISLWKCSNIEASDNTEVTGSPFQSNPQVAVFVSISIEYPAIGKDDLEVFNVIANQALPCTEIGYSSCVTGQGRERRSFVLEPYRQ